MTYNNKLNPQKIYNTIIADTHNTNTKLIIEHIDSFMSEYTPEELINKITEFINDCVGGEINDCYKNMTEEEYISLAEFPEDIIKIKKDFSEYGFDITALEAEAIWCIRSDNWAAQWIGIDESEDTFLESIKYGLITAF